MVPYLIITLPLRPVVSGLQSGGFTLRQTRNVRVPLVRSLWITIEMKFLMCSWDSFRDVFTLNFGSKVRDEFVIPTQSLSACNSWMWDRGRWRLDAVEDWYTPCSCPRDGTLLIFLGDTGRGINSYASRNWWTLACSLSREGTSQQTWDLFRVHPMKKQKLLSSFVIFLLKSGEI